MDQAPPVTQSRIRILLVLIIVVVFGQVVGFEFVNFDDPMYVNNLYVSQGLTWEGIRWAFVRIDQNFFMPLTWISHMVDVELFGHNPAGHHGVNLLLHTINTLLFFGWLARVTGSPLKSAFAAALFAIHPLRVETVAWVADRKDLLAMLFALLALESYRKYVKGGGRRNYVMVTLFYILALISKPVMVVFPCVLLLLDVWPHNRVMGDKGAFVAWAGLIKEKLPWFGISALFVWLGYKGQAAVTVIASLDALPLWTRLANLPVIMMKYLGFVFWPSGLTAFYPAVFQQAPLWQTAGALLVLTGFTVWGIRQWRRFPYFLTGWLWFLGALFPMIGLVKLGHHEMADRYTYFPLMGLCILIAWGMVDLLKYRERLAKFAPIAVVGLLVVLMTVSWSQTRVWENSVTLFQHTVDHTERNDFAHNNLGHALMLDGKTEESILHFKKALEYNPRRVIAHLNLAKAYRNLDRTPEAILSYNHILQIQPNHVVVHFELGKLYHKVGDGPHAVHHTRIAHELLVRSYGLEFDKTREAEANLKHYYKVYNLKP